MLFDGEKVCEYLAGMTVVGKAVDDGKTGVFRKFFNVGLFESTDHDTVEISAENTCGIFDGFTSAELKIVAGKEERIAAELLGSPFSKKLCI